MLASDERLLDSTAMGVTLVNEALRRRFAGALRAFLREFTETSKFLE
jgi:hypothetical protein